MIVDFVRYRYADSVHLFALPFCTLGQQKGTERSGQGYAGYRASCASGCGSNHGGRCQMATSGLLVGRFHLTVVAAAMKE